MPSVPLQPGIFVPVLSFFHPDSEDLDVPTFKKHIARVSKAGMQLVLQGTTAEAIHLTREERITLIKAAKEVLEELGFGDRPIIAGAGSGSTRQTIEYARDAAEAGATHVIVISPGYFAASLDKPALKKFFVDVAQASPIPVLMYNYPGASAGIDLDSDFIIDVAKSAPNTCGIKLTCNQIGKLSRVAAFTSTPEFIQKYPRSNPDSRFLVLTGLADTLISALAAKGAGAITGLGNFAPKACVWHYKKALKAMSDPSAEALKEAQSAQALISLTEFQFGRGGIAASKWMLQKEFGYGGVPRGPLLPFDAEKGPALAEAAKELLELEKSLP